MKFNFKVKKNKNYLIGFFLSAVLVSNSSYGVEVVSVVEGEIQPFTEAEIQQGLADMRNKMNSRIEAWGNRLSRADFERKRGKLVLRSAKQQEVCNIFQGVIDETYVAAQKNKLRLKPSDQQALESRITFIQALGIKNNIIPTKLGFDCRVK